MRHALASGAQGEYLRRLRGAYASRSAALSAALAAHAGRAGWTFRRPDGGYFLWLRLPDGLTGKEVAAAGEAAGVKAREGRGGSLRREKRFHHVAVRTHNGRAAARIAPGPAPQVLDGARCTIMENRRVSAVPPGAEAEAGWYGDVQRHVRCCFAYLDEDQITAGAGPGRDRVGAS